MDRGYAWAVAGAAMGINFIMAGLGRMSGILYVAFIDIYGVDRAGAAMPFSVRSSARNLLGPIVGILGQKYGVQTIIIAGGIIGTVSTVFCFFAPGILWITILFGGLGGMGAAFSTSLNQVVIGQYFQKYRTTAGGMGFSGGCIGSFLFPALMEYLILNYGIDGTFLFIAGITMHTIPAAMIMKKPHWVKDGNRQKITDDKMNNLSDASLRRVENEIKNINSSVERSSAKISVDAQFLRRNKDLVIKVLTMEPQSYLNNASKRQMALESKAVVETCVWEAIEDILYSLQLLPGQLNFGYNERLSKNNIFAEMSKTELKQFNDSKAQTFHIGKNSRPEYDGQCPKTTSASDVSTVSDDISKSYVLMKIKSVLNTGDAHILDQFPGENRESLAQLLSELKKLHQSLSKVETENESQQPSRPVVASVQPSKPDEHSNTFWTHIKTALRLHKNPLFILISMSRAVHLISFVPVVTTVVDFTKDKGFPEDQGKFVIAALSLGDLLGRLCLGWVTDREFMELPKYVLTVMVVQGAVTCTLPLMPTRATILVALGVFGMLQGSLFVRHPVLVNLYFGSHEQSIAMGCMNFFSGLLALVLPLYIGYFRDTLSSYDYIFFINGTIGTAVGLLWTLEPFFVRMLAQSKQPINDGVTSA